MQEPQLKKSRVSVCGFFLIMGMIFGTWASRIPAIKAQLSLDDAQLGNILFAIPLGQMTAMFLSAWIIKRIESKKALVIAGSITPLFILFAGLSDGIEVLVTSLFLFGMSDNLFNISANTQGVNVEHEYGRTIMATFHGLFSMGGFMGGLLGLIFSFANIGPVIHFAFVCIISIILSLSFGRGLIIHDFKQSFSAESSEQIHKACQFDRYVFILGFMALFAMICEGVMYDWSGVYFDDIVKVKEGYVQLGYVICMGTMTLGRFLSDSFVNKYGAISVIRISGLLIFVGLLLSAIFPSVLIASIGFAIIGFGIASTVPICNSLAGKGKIYTPSTALAIVTSIGFFGFLLGPPLIGHIASEVTLRWTFAIMSIMGLCIVVFTYLMNIRLNKTYIYEQ